MLKNSPSKPHIKSKQKREIAPAPLEEFIEKAMKIGKGIARDPKKLSAIIFTRSKLPFNSKHSDQRIKEKKKLNNNNHLINAIIL